MSDYLCYFDASLYTIIIYNNSDDAELEKTLIIPINTFNELKKIRDSNSSWLKDKIRSNINSVYQKCRTYGEFKEKITDISIMRGDKKDICDLDMSFFNVVDKNLSVDTVIINPEIWKYNVDIIVLNIVSQIRAVIVKDTDYLTHLLNKYMKEITIFDDSNSSNCHFV